MRTFPASLTVTIPSSRSNLLGGLGSAITYNSGSKYLLLPDRGPIAVTFDAAIDNTVSYCQPVTYESEPVFYIRLYG